MLEGKVVNLRVMEKDDFPIYVEWMNKPEFVGEYFFPLQRAMTEIEKARETNPFESKTFIVEKKDGTKIGWISHFYMLHPMAKLLEIGYAIVPNERSKGYCAEAVKIMVDYLFLTKEAVFIQAMTDVKNIASQRVLEKAGFQKEGTIRKRFFTRGEWKDAFLFSILREEWKEPRILTKTTLQT